MRKIVMFNLVSVDGLFAGTKGEIDWHNYDEEMGMHSVPYGRARWRLMV